MARSGDAVIYIYIYIVGAAEDMGSAEIGDGFP